MSQNNVINILSENMALLDKRQSACAELRQLTLTQFIEFSRKSSPLENISDVNSVYASALSLDGKLSCEEKIFVCRTLSENKELNDALAKMLLNAIEGAPNDVQGRIAYVRNEHNDDAFAAFSDKIKGARTFYAPTFSDCCEAVVDGKCEYCILPIENSEGGKLHSFYSLIDRYELKICHSERCASENSQEVLYALAAKNIPVANLSATPLRFEFTVIRENNEYIDDIITALRTLSCSIHSLGTQPVEYDSQKQKCIFSVDVPNASLTPLLIYLENEYPRYSSIGLYKIDKEI